MDTDFMNPFRIEQTYWGDVVWDRRNNLVVFDSMWFNGLPKFRQLILEETPPPQPPTNLKEPFGIKYLPRLYSYSPITAKVWWLMTDNQLYGSRWSRVSEEEFVKWLTEDLGFTGDGRMVPLAIDLSFLDDD
jgi:hypothetical protein